MIHLENHGIIIRELRTLKDLSVRKAAALLERSVGWLSEIENGSGTARLSPDEFDRVVTALDGDQYRAMFKTWTANSKNRERTDKTYDGAVLKYIRKKKNLRLCEAAKLIGISVGYLCKLEIGLKPVGLQLRQQIMRAYGYSPTSFRNLSTDPVKSKAVPARFRFEILYRTLSAEQVAELFKTVTSKKQEE
jgi:transcriptional regulator with XRE-family HTH domain